MNKSDSTHNYLSAADPLRKEPTLKEWWAMTDEEREQWFCNDWEEEGHLCANVWCPGCE